MKTGGLNSSEAAGQTVFHAHWHLIPRREGDWEEPRGGVLGVIPGAWPMAELESISRARSCDMAAIRGKNIGPALDILSTLNALGLGFTIDRMDLYVGPGTALQS